VLQKQAFVSCGFPPFVGCLILSTEKLKSQPLSENKKSRYLFSANRLKALNDFLAILPKRTQKKTRAQQLLLCSRV